MYENLKIMDDEKEDTTMLENINLEIPEIINNEN
jgi:hypothetical protein